MATAETHQSLDDTMRSASESMKAGAPVLLPWRMEANQDYLYAGLAVCGCAFTPDEPKDEIS
jgi:hypothetical protein